MKCKGCKRNIDDDSIYCKWCGEKQIKDRSERKEVSVPKPKQLPSGTWQANMMIDGQRISVSAGSEAEYYAKARALKAGLIKAKQSHKATLREILRQYIDSNTNTLSPSTIRGYEIICRNRFVTFADKDINRINWQQMVNIEAAKVSPKTVHNAWGLVHRSLMAAGIEPPIVNLPAVARYEGDWLDYEQIHSFLAAVRGEPVELAALLALHSLRQSELLAVNVEDITANSIRVHGAVVMDKNSKFVRKDTNKNRSSDRTVPILIPRLLELLPTDGPVVNIHPSSIARGLKKVCVAAGLPVVTVHDLRRSFASLAYHLGWSDRTTMAVGGWSDMATVQAVYQRQALADRQADVERMKEFYSLGG